MTTNLVPQAVIVKAKKDATHLASVANDIVVSTAEQENEAYISLKEIKASLKTIEDRRKSITKPLNASLKEVNAMFKTLAEPFKEADGIIRQKVLTFRQEEEEKTRIEQERLDAEAKAEQERREKIQASHAERGHDTHELEEVVAEEVEADVAETTVVAKRWTIKITDPKKLPEKVLRGVLNTEEGFEIVEKWLRKQLRNAPRNEDNKPLMAQIPGVEIYQEEGLRV